MRYLLKYTQTYILVFIYGMVKVKNLFPNRNESKKLRTIPFSLNDDDDFDAAAVSMYENTYIRLVRNVYFTAMMMVLWVRHFPSEINCDFMTPTSKIKRITLFWHAHDDSVNFFKSFKQEEEKGTLKYMKIMMHSF